MDTRKIKRLAKMLQSPNVKYRQDAAMALWTIEDDQIVKFLIPALLDEDELVRYFAALGLGNSGNNKVVPELQRAFNLEEDPWLRLWIGVPILSLGEISVLERVFEDIKTVDEMGLEDWDNHQLIVGALAELGNEVLPYIRPKLEDDNKTIRWLAELTITEIESRDS